MARLRPRAHDPKRQNGKQRPGPRRNEKEERRAQTDSPKRKGKDRKTRGGKKARRGERSISRFVVFARDKGATVRLEGNAPLRYKSMNLTNPDRVVVDLVDSGRSRLGRCPKNPLVSNVAHRQKWRTRPAWSSTSSKTAKYPLCACQGRQHPGRAGGSVNSFLLLQRQGKALPSIGRGFIHVLGAD